MLQPKASEPQNQGLAPGVSYYQVLVPSKVLGPGGVQQFGMMGPFLDLLEANAHAQKTPGALITVTLVLLQSVGIPPAAVIAK